MGLTTGVPVIVPVGAGSRPAQLARLGPLLEKVVATVAEEVEATVVGAGTAGGLGEALGQARRRKKAGFPMIGVASDGSEPEDLEPEHTHFVLVPADHGAGVARWVAEVATAAAGGNRSVAVVTAGGEPAWEAVAAHARAGRLVMAVGRTGGVADQLAARLQRPCLRPPGPSPGRLRPGLRRRPRQGCGPRGRRPAGRPQPAQRADARPAIASKGGVVVACCTSPSPAGWPSRPTAPASTPAGSAASAGWPWPTWSPSGTGPSPATSWPRCCGATTCPGRGRRRCGASPSGCEACSAPPGWCRPRP